MTAILAIAAPLMLATIGALFSEHAGVLAVFMDGAITLSAFICIAVTFYTGNAYIGFAAAATLTVLILLLAGWYTHVSRANPFLIGLAINLLATGLTSLFSSILFGTRGVIALPAEGAFDFPLTGAIVGSFASAALAALFLYRTKHGLILRVTGDSGEALASRGLPVHTYKIFSWCLAAFFAACAGSFLALRLGAFVPNISAGRGWTALAAVFLGNKKPLLCVGAVLTFAGADYLANILQGTGAVPATLILGLPYALALLAFIFFRKKNAIKD